MAAAMPGGLGQAPPPHFAPVGALQAQPLQPSVPSFQSNPSNGFYGSNAGTEFVMQQPSQCFTQSYVPSRPNMNGYAAAPAPQMSGPAMPGPKNGYSIQSSNNCYHPSQSGLGGYSDQFCVPCRPQMMYHGNSPGSGNVPSLPPNSFNTQSVPPMMGVSNGPMQYISSSSYQTPYPKQYNSFSNVVPQQYSPGSTGAGPQPQPNAAFMPNPMKSGQLIGATEASYKSISYSSFQNSSQTPNFSNPMQGMNGGQKYVIRSNQSFSCGPMDQPRTALAPKHLGIPNSSCSTPNQTFSPDQSLAMKRSYSASSNSLGQIEKVPYSLLNNLERQDHKEAKARKSSDSSSNSDLVFNNNTIPNSPYSILNNSELVDKMLLQIIVGCTKKADSDPRELLDFPNLEDQNLLMKLVEDLSIDKLEKLPDFNPNLDLPSPSPDSSCGLSLQKTLSYPELPV